MLNYARMMPVYLSHIKLKDSESTVYAEFLQGNWVVNKNPLPFQAVGADHALEHINRAMKVSGGLVGITLNPSARTKFILIAPELARLAREAEEMAGYSPSSRMRPKMLFLCVTPSGTSQIHLLEKAHCCIIWSQRQSCLIR